MIQDKGPLDTVDAHRMPLIDHLVELRDRLVRIIIFTTIGCVACFGFAQPIWEALVNPMNEALAATGRGTMAITEPLEGFMTYLKVAGLAGVGLASPFIFHQTWSFIAPGLYPKEKKAIAPLAVASTVLFIGGAAFGYFIIFDFAFPFFLEVTASLDQDIEAVLSISAYLGLVTKLLLAFGGSFQLPIVIYFLARIGLVDHKDLFHSFRYAVVTIFLAAAVITPPDVLSQCLMAGPLIVLYGVGTVLAYFVSTKVREEDNEDNPEGETAAPD
jgi:sec-independent protein translocase protein TatC